MKKFIIPFLLMLTSSAFFSNSLFNENEIEKYNLQEKILQREEGTYFVYSSSLKVNKNIYLEIFYYPEEYNQKDRKNTAHLRLLFNVYEGEDYLGVDSIRIYKDSLKLINLDYRELKGSGYERDQKENEFIEYIIFYASYRPFYKNLVKLIEAKNIKVEMVGREKTQEIILNQEEIKAIQEILEAFESRDKDLKN